MALLTCLASGEQRVLFAEHTVGRSRRCALQLDDELVSSEHALLRWVGARWEVHDLGSRNGTFVELTRLEPGERKPLRVGSLLCFGRRDQPWRMDSVDPPVATAVPLGGATAASAQIIAASGGLLGIPNLDEPEVVVFRDRQNSWLQEQDGRSAPVEDQACLSVAGRVWRLHLPTPTPPTGTPELDERVSLDNIALRFVVSRDEEHVEAYVVARGEPISLGARTHHYTLLTLARLRIRDQQDASQERASQGWVHADDLTRMLRIDDNKLNVDIHRARRQLAQRGIERAGGLVERRSSARMLRIGVERCLVEVR